MNNNYPTIAYFDIFHYPLTWVELQTWRYQVGGDQVKEQAVKEYNGFYYLAGHEDYIMTRQERYLYSDHRIERVRKYIKLFRLLPSVRMIALCNSLGYQNASSESDIDFFIIVKTGTVWLTRFWLQSFVRVFRLGPFDRGGRADSLCLTFFLTSDKLNISGLQIGADDIYLHYWITQLMPLYDPYSEYKKFLEANVWVRRFIPDFLPCQLLFTRQVRRSFWSVLFRVFTIRWWEPVLRKIQLAIMPENLRSRANCDTCVVMNEGVLKFHVEDNREKYKTLWRQKLNS